MAQKNVLVALFAAALNCTAYCAYAHDSKIISQVCGEEEGPKVVCGKASYYGGKKFEGLQTANGEIFTSSGFTAAVPQKMKHLLGYFAHVVNPDNGASVVVRITDTGAFKHPLDLTFRAFSSLLDKGDNPKDIGKIEVKVMFARHPDHFPQH